jgi:hypothetical protein
MRRNLLFALVLVLGVGGGVLGWLSLKAKAARNEAIAAKQRAAEEPKADKKGRAPYAHVVIFRMKKDTPKDVASKAIADCHELLAKIPAVRSVRAGRPAAKGTPDVPKMQYDFALLVLLDNAEGLQAYLEHPLHLRFVEKYGPSFDMEKLQVFDFLNQMK